MEINQEFIDTLTKFETDLLKAFLDIKGIKSANIPEIDQPLVQDECIYCGSTNIIKNGRSAKGRQRYLCKDCKKTFTAITKSFFKHTRLSYTQWVKFLECEIVGLTLKETAYQIGISKTSCFYMRHKLYKSLEKFQAKKLKREVQLDTTFLDMDLKGLKIMPKPVKGSKKNPSVKCIFDRDPHICISTAVDYKGSILFRISGYGGESSNKYQKHIDYYDENCKIISDKSSTILKFAKQNNFKCMALKEGYHKTKDGKHISDVNSLHSDLKNLIRNKRGVSLRHLQGYLNWIVFKRYFIRIKRNLWGLETYRFIKDKEKELRNTDICKKEFPISLEEIYGRYHYGMFA